MKQAREVKIDYVPVNIDFFGEKQKELYLGFLGWARVLLVSWCYISYPLTGWAFTLKTEILAQLTSASKTYEQKKHGWQEHRFDKDSFFIPAEDCNNW